MMRGITVRNDRASPEESTIEIPFEKFRDEACRHFVYEPGLFDRMCTYTFDDATDGTEDGESGLFDDDPFRVDVACNEENCPFMKEG